MADTTSPRAVALTVAPAHADTGAAASPTSTAAERDTALTGLRAVLNAVEMLADSQRVLAELDAVARTSPAVRSAIADACPTWASAPRGELAFERIQALALHASGLLDVLDADDLTF